MQFCSFPTTVLLVDDNPAYIKVFKEIIEEIPVLKRTMNNLKVVDYLHHYKPPVDFSKAEVPKSVSYSNEYTIVSNLPKIHKMIYEKRRFNTISVIILDYLMPGKTGREIIEEITNVSIKKVFLTSFMVPEEAIDLLTKKKVNQYFNKYDKDFILNASKYLFGTISKFFQEKVKFEYTSVPFTKNPFLCCLIRQYIEKKKPVEYYVLDYNGSYLFVDTDAKLSGLFVYNDEDIFQLASIFAQNKMFGDKYDALMQKKLVLAATGNAIAKYRAGQIGVDYLFEHLVPAKFITDPTTKGSMYYTYSEDQSSFLLDKSRIVSFNEVKKKLDHSELI